MPRLADIEQPGTAPNVDDLQPSVEASVQEVGQVHLPPGVFLTVGETILVHYSDGVVLHERVAASCQVTATAGKPFKNLKYNTAQANFSYGLSSGCGSSQGATAYLKSSVSPYGLKTWSKYASTKPGYTIFWAVHTPCVKGYSRGWSSQIGAPAIGDTPSVTLACEGGYFS